MSEIMRIFDMPVPIWFFGSLMLTCMWFLKYQNDHFRGSWPRHIVSLRFP